MTIPAAPDLPLESEADALAAWVLRTRSAAGAARIAALADADPEEWAPAHGRVLALLPPGDADAAIDRLRSVSDRLEESDLTLYGQLLLRAGRRDEAADLVASGRLATPAAWELRTDLANPFLAASAEGGEGPGTPDDAALEAWLARLGTPFVKAGLEPPVLDPTGLPNDATPFGRLRAVPTSRVDASDVVTVVVSTFSPGPDLLTSLRSLTDQSWAALEILVVDDASGPASRDLLEQAAALDDRIRVLHADVNSGTYAARNRAMAAATGRYVTFHDDDDWAHPRRVERQVAALTDETGTRVSSRSGCLRAYPDLTLTYVGYPSGRLNASSLLLERRVALRTVGGYHLVRKSADMEYPARLRAATGMRPRDMPVGVPLAVTQLRQGSLSRGDTVPGWTRWDRIAYRDAYRTWHRRIGVGTASPYLPLTSAPPAPLAGPGVPTPAFAAWSGPAAPQDLDVVLLGDLRTDHLTVRRAAAELRTLADTGLRVGVVHLDPAVRARGRPGGINRAVAELVSDGHAVWADPDLEATVGLALVLDPPTLVLRDAGLVRWQVERTLLCVRRPEDLTTDVPAGTGPPDPAALEAAATTVLGPRPEWRALTAEGAALVAAHDLAGPGLVPWAVAPWARVRADRSEDDRLRVGHGALSHPMWDPALPLRRWFPDDDRVDVRFAGGETAARRALGQRTPANWLFLDESLGADDLGFAASLDVVALPVVDEDAVAAAREAVALGGVVLVDRTGRDAVAATDPWLAEHVRVVDERLTTAVLTRLATSDRADPDAVRAEAERRIAALLPARRGTA